MSNKRVHCKLGLKTTRYNLKIFYVWTSFNKFIETKKINKTMYNLCIGLVKNNFAYFDRKWCESAQILRRMRKNEWVGSKMRIIKIRELKEKKIMLRRIEIKRKSNSLIYKMHTRANLYTQHWDTKPKLHDVHTLQYYISMHKILLVQLFNQVILFLILSCCYCSDQ
jgi:hypothetical protein